MSKKYDYDVAIIGSGIGGLVCGCYLAKAGLKTLIVEKNKNVGGYCTSFKRKGYRFDACVHFLSTLRKESKFYKILDSINTFNKIDFVRHNPSDIIITPQFSLRVFNKIKNTISDFQKRFPSQKKQIEQFFNYIADTPTSDLVILRNKTLQALLDDYFNDELLKTILSSLILGLAGSPPNNISAVVSCLIFREFLFCDGGYYPIGGMQAFSDALTSSFKDYGGELLLSAKVKSINCDEKLVSGISISKKDDITAKYVVSACDARHTFLELLGSKALKANFKKSIEKLKPSYSSFLVYIGLNDDCVLSPDLKSNMWIINDSHINKIVTKLSECKNVHMAITSPSMKSSNFSDEKKSICLTTTVPFINQDYWQDKNSRLSLESRLIDMFLEVMPNLKNDISIKLNATPLTLYNWTMNYHGAAYGWEGRPCQFGNPDISEKTYIENLYLTGHWTNMGSGITSVANSGYDTAKAILFRNNT